VFSPSSRPTFRSRIPGFSNLVDELYTLEPGEARETNHAA
jgi:hypothetical protein